jgi:hypothetical protein
MDIIGVFLALLEIKTMYAPITAARPAALKINWCRFLAKSSI